MDNSLRQSRHWSALEAVANVASGFVIAALTWQFIIRPLIYNGTLSIDSTLPITIIFTVISLIRGYTWRRIFNKL